MSAISGRVERRRSLGEVVAHDSGVADLLIAECQLVMGEPYRLGVVGKLGVFQRPHMERNRA